MDLRSRTWLSTSLASSHRSVFARPCRCLQLTRGDQCIMQQLAACSYALLACSINRSFASASLLANGENPSSLARTPLTSVLQAFLSPSSSRLDTSSLSSRTGSPGRAGSLPISTASRRSLQLLSIPNDNITHTGFQWIARLQFNGRSVLPSLPPPPLTRNSQNLRLRRRHWSRTQRLRRYRRPRRPSLPPRNASLRLPARPPRVHHCHRGVFDDRASVLSSWRRQACGSAGE